MRITTQLTRPWSALQALALPMQAQRVAMTSLTAAMLKPMRMPIQMQCQSRPSPCRRLQRVSPRQLRRRRSTIAGQALERLPRQSHHRARLHRQDSQPALLGVL